MPARGRGRRSTASYAEPGSAALTIVNPDPRYAPVDLGEQVTRGYVHIGVAVRPGPVPVLQPRGRTKSQLIAALKRHAQRLERLDGVDRATVFDAIVMPPIDQLGRYLTEQAGVIHPARFDVAVLIATTSPSAALEVKATPEFAALLDTVRVGAEDLHIVGARVAKRIADVDTSRDGLFLFNHFVADDTDVMLALWDYLAGWYAVETGLDNSILLAPLECEHSDYVAINHARWDLSLPGLLARQLSKTTFRTYVQANLEANRVGSMPVLYRLA